MCLTFERWRWQIRFLLYLLVMFMALPCIDNKAHGYKMDLIDRKKARIDTYFGTINKIWVQKNVGQGLRPVTFDSRKGLKCRPPFVLNRNLIAIRTILQFFLEIQTMVVSSHSS